MVREAGGTVWSLECSPRVFAFFACFLRGAPGVGLWPRRLGRSGSRVRVVVAGLEMLTNQKTVRLVEVSSQPVGVLRFGVARVPPWYYCGSK